VDNIATLLRAFEPLDATPLSGARAHLRQRQQSSGMEIGLRPLASVHAIDAAEAGRFDQGLAELEGKGQIHSVLKAGFRNLLVSRAMQKCDTRFVMSPRRKSTNPARYMCSAPARRSLHIWSAKGRTPAASRIKKERPFEHVNQRASPWHSHS
jgi:hypothetical protein